jgi:hypothetical protein
VDAEAAIRLLRNICLTGPSDRRRSAKSFHDAVDFALVQHGWTVYRECLAPHHGLRRRGLIDLVVTAPLPIGIGIELDRSAPREKSLLASSMGSRSSSYAMAEAACGAGVMSS